MGPAECAKNYGSWSKLELLDVPAVARRRQCCQECTSPRASGRTAAEVRYRAVAGGCVRGGAWGAGVVIGRGHSEDVGVNSQRRS